MDGTHYQIMTATLAGRRPIDDHTHMSLAVLKERLDDVRSHGGLFAGIEFSGHVKALKQRCEPLTVG